VGENVGVEVGTFVGALDGVGVVFEDMGLAVAGELGVAVPFIGVTVGLSVFVILGVTDRVGEKVGLAVFGMLAVPVSVGEKVELDVCACVGLAVLGFVESLGGTLGIMLGLDLLG
jgi:hypothetical protein